jgi:hypothetical protein
MIKELIARCLEDNHDAWDQLWEMVAASIRRPMDKAGGTVSVEDAEQEFYLFLSEDGCRRLRNFRGNDEAEFRSYLRVIVAHFLCSHRASCRRTEARQGKAHQAVARTEVEGPTEPELLAILREFIAVASTEERRQLDILLGWKPEPDVAARGSRTLRRWRSHLVARYRECVH